MPSEIEKLRKEREDEIRRGKEAALDQQEETSLNITTTLFAIIGFFSGCQKYIQVADSPRFLDDLGQSFFSFFYFLIGMGAGWLIGWILVKIVFKAIRSSK